MWVFGGCHGDVRGGRSCIGREGEDGDLKKVGDLERHGHTEHCDIYHLPDLMVGEIQYLLQIL